VSVTTTADYTAASGVITNTTASYRDAGAFNLLLQDRTFTAVDSTDPGYPVPATHYISSSAVTVGRFVPDHFKMSAATITPRSDIGACSGSTFTYMSERMTLGFTLTAYASDSSTVTAAYSGATLGALALGNFSSYGFGAIDSVAPTPLTSRLALASGGSITGSWSSGAATISAPVSLNRNATPDGPYTSLKIGIVPSDPDSVTLRTADLNLDADNVGGNDRVQIGGTTATRFGRLRLQGAIGSELADLAIPMTAQYWNGSAFVTNPDDSCTSLTAANLTLGAYSGGINGTNMGAPGHISLGGAFSSGIGSLKLTKPSPVPTSPGSTTVTVDLSAEAKTYLQGNWGVSTYTANPSARAGFGLFSSQPRNFIFNRENY
jgi:MSHA biogenesis protein MshQ